MNRSRVVRRSVALGGFFGLANCHADALFTATRARAIEPPVQLTLHDTWGNEATDLR